MPGCSGSGIDGHSLGRPRGVIAGTTPFNVVNGGKETADTLITERIAGMTVGTSGDPVAGQALQLHGGYGHLTEYGIEKIVRDLRVHRILEGTNEIMSLIIARRLTGAA